MRKLLLFPALITVITGAARAQVPELDAAIEAARVACSEISSDMEHLKKMAGISTGVNAAGTVAGGAALVTGIKKSGIDKKIEAIRAELASARDAFMNRNSGANPTRVSSNPDSDASWISNVVATAMKRAGGKDGVNNELADLSDKSKTFGNVRTGTLAVSTATNLTGAIVSGKSRVDADLDTRIAQCRDSVKKLNDAYMQARMIMAEEDVPTVAQAENIIKECGAWDGVNLDKINKKATGATVTNAVGTGLGLVGTFTSAMANKNSQAGTDPSHKLDTTANVMAGGATATSGVAMILNATQIKDIKRAVAVAENCEGALQ